MPTLRNGVESDSRVLEPTLEVLLAVAARHSGRCYICRWIVANQGCHTDRLNPLLIAEVTISADSQQLHLSSHFDAGPEVAMADAKG